MEEKTTEIQVFSPITEIKTATHSFAEKISAILKENELKAKQYSINEEYSTFVQESAIFNVGKHKVTVSLVTDR